MSRSSGRLRVELDGSKYRLQQPPARKGGMADAGRDNRARVQMFLESGAWQDCALLPQRYFDGLLPDEKPSFLRYTAQIHALRENLRNGALFGEDAERVNAEIDHFLESHPSSEFIN